LGGRVEQFYCLDEAVPVNGSVGAGKATIWAERLQTLSPDAEVLLRYGPSNGWLDDRPAMLTRRLGNGRITYLGAWLDEASMQAAVSWMLHSSSVQPVFGPVPREVEVCRRQAPGRQVFLLINHSAEQKSVRLPRRFRSVLDDITVEEHLTLPPRAAEVLLEETNHD